MHLLRWICWAMIWAVGSARADYVDDLVRIHIDALGGRARLARLAGLRATGFYKADGHELRFEMIAQRPNRVRVTTTGEGRTLIQATDGSATPWRLESEKSPVARLMSDEEAAGFLADAEFDDQLVDSAERGYRLDFAGEAKLAGTRVFKILVTHLKQKPFFLLLDAERYFIVGRLTTRVTAVGREVTVETRYADFRPVEGVLLAHRIRVYFENRLLNETVLESLEANPPIEAELFRMPTEKDPAQNE